MRRILMTFVWTVLALGLGVGSAHAQRGRMNLPSFDNRAYHFGFILSGNQAISRWLWRTALAPISAALPMNRKVDSTCT